MEDMVKLYIEKRRQYQEKISSDLQKIEENVYDICEIGDYFSIKNDEEIITVKAIKLDGDKHIAIKSGNMNDFIALSNLRLTDHPDLILWVIQNSKIIVIGSSILGGARIPLFSDAQLLDAEGKQPVSMFVRNAVDYLNGEEDLCTMRTKGLSLNTLTVKSAAASTFAKYFNEIGLVVIVAVCGLLVLLKIKAKKRAIRERYNPNDSRIEK